MNLVSLCGCIRMDIDAHARDMSRKMKTAPSLLAFHTAKHYKLVPGCRLKAEADPIWKERRPIPEEKEEGDNDKG